MWIMVGAVKVGSLQPWLESEWRVRSPEDCALVIDLDRSCESGSKLEKDVKMSNIDSSTRKK